MTGFGATALIDSTRRTGARTQGGSQAGSDDQAAVPISRIIDDAVALAVIPRLRRALGAPLDKGHWDKADAAGSAQARLGRREIKPRDVERLIALVMGSGPEAARVLIDGLMAHGCDRGTIFCDLLAPAARRIGDIWLDDDCSFTDVTMSVGRLQSLLRDLSPPSHAEARKEAGPTILLCPYPPEQHSFGLAMVEEFFRSAGWKVTVLHDSTIEALETKLANREFDLLGLSLSCDGYADGLVEAIARLRKLSRNPDLAVILGGPVIAADEGLARLWGADAGVSDARGAVSVAQQLLANTRLRR